MKCPHCGVEISEHSASRCLDAWVAEDVMGWKVNTEDWHVAKPHTDRKDTYWNVPLTRGKWGAWCPSEDIAATWEVERKIEERKLKSRYVQALLAAMLSMEVNSDEDMWWLLAHASPLDRCRAAIKACPKRRVNDDAKN